MQNTASLYFHNTKILRYTPLKIEKGLTEVIGGQKTIIGAELTNKQASAIRPYAYTSSLIRSKY